VDLCEQGANQGAFVRLFKRKGKPRNAPSKPEDETVIKNCDAATFDDALEMERLHELSNEVYNYGYIFMDSLCSILRDDEMDEENRRSMMFQSLDEYAETLRTAIPLWAAGKSDENAEKIEKSDTRKTAFEMFWKTAINQPDIEPQPEASLPEAPLEQPAKKGDVTPLHSQKEEQELKFDKSKMTSEEVTILADYERRYGVVEKQAQVTPPATVPVAPVAPAAAPEIHPDVKKALAEFEEVKKAQAAEIQKQKDELESLRKRVEIEQLVGFAKKYELIGKKSDELATKLYDLKKAGGTAYDDYVALLDEHLTTVEKSGLFREVGKNTTGGGNTGDKLKAAASEIAKSGNVKGIDAIIKAFEDNPELAAQYEDEYMGGN